MSSYLKDVVRHDLPLVLAFAEAIPAAVVAQALSTRGGQDEERGTYTYYYTTTCGVNDNILDDGQLTDSD